MAMKLDDLSLEDRQAILAEAREIVEQENIAKNATAMYAMKKRELVSKEVDEIVHIIGLRQGPESSKARERFIHMSNYLYSLNNSKGNQGTYSKIHTAEEWELFVNICKNVKECMVHSVHASRRKK